MEEVLRIALVPLRTLYFKGPSWGHWGFWEGRGPDDVCAELTRVEATHWNTELGQMACQDLLERKFSAFAIGTISMCLVALTFSLCSHWLTYHSTTKPIARAISKEIKRQALRDLRERRRSRTGVVSESGSEESSEESV